MIDQSDLYETVQGQQKQKRTFRQGMTLDQYLATTTTRQKSPKPQIPLENPNSPDSNPMNKKHKRRPKQQQNLYITSGQSSLQHEQQNILIKILNQHQQGQENALGSDGRQKRSNINGNGKQKYGKNSQKFITYQIHQIDQENCQEEIFGTYGFEEKEEIADRKDVTTMRTTQSTIPISVSGANFANFLNSNAHEAKNFKRVSEQKPEKTKIQQIRDWQKQFRIRRQSNSPYKKTPQPHSSLQPINKIFSQTQYNPFSNLNLNLHINSNSNSNTLSASNPHLQPQSPIQKSQFQPLNPKLSTTLYNKFSSNNNAHINNISAVSNSNSNSNANFTKNYNYNHHSYNYNKDSYGIPFHSIFAKNGEIYDMKSTGIGKNGIGIGFQKEKEKERERNGSLGRNRVGDREKYYEYREGLRKGIDQWKIRDSLTKNHNPNTHQNHSNPQSHLPQIFSIKIQGISDRLYERKQPSHVHVNAHANVSHPHTINTISHYGNIIVNGHHRIGHGNGNGNNGSSDNNGNGSYENRSGNGNGIGSGNKKRVK